MQIFLLLLPLIAAAWMAVIHIIRTRACNTFIATTNIFYGFAIGLILMMIGIISITITNCTLRSFADSIAALFFYFTLAYCYYHFVNIGEASIRLRIFSELLQKRHLTPEELICYQEKELPSRRIERLLSHGDIFFQNGFYAIGNQRYVIASKILQLAKHILGIQSTFNT